MRRVETSLLVRTAAVVVTFLVLLAAIPSSLARAEDTEVTVGPQFNIFVGPGDQGWGGVSVAFDPGNSRFLVVWTDARVSPQNIYGQLVNSDGTLHGGPIPIVLNTSEWGGDGPKAGFDPVSKRFLVVWRENRGSDWWGGWHTWGQLITAEGALVGGAFDISNLKMGPTSVVYDSVSRRFLVVMVGEPTGGFYDPSNVFARLVSPDPDGPLSSSVVQITTYGGGCPGSCVRAFDPQAQFDPSHNRFLVTWGYFESPNGPSGLAGRLMNADGTFVGSDFQIGYFAVGGGSGYLPSLSFDPVNSRFLQVWNAGGFFTGAHYLLARLINADGTLYGDELHLPNTYDAGPTAVFDNASNKFLVVSLGSYPHTEIRGQLLDPDGSLHGPLFGIVSSRGACIRPAVAYGSQQTGSLVAGNCVVTYESYESTGYDIAGTFVKTAAGQPPPPLDTTPPTITIATPQPGDYLTSESLTIGFSAEDTLSGIASVSATLDGETVGNGQVIDLAALAGAHHLAVSATDRAGNSATAEVDFQVLIAATVDIQPDTLNLGRNKGNGALTAYIEFTPGYDVAQIDVGSIRLQVNRTFIEAQSAPTGVGDYDGDGVADRMVKFDRQAVILALAGSTGDATLTLTGSLTDGTEFVGEDTIRLLTR